MLKKVLHPVPRYRIEAMGCDIDAFIFAETSRTEAPNLSDMKLWPLNDGFVALPLSRNNIVHFIQNAHKYPEVRYDTPLINSILLQIISFNEDLDSSFLDYEYRFEELVANSLLLPLILLISQFSKVLYVHVDSHGGPPISQYVCGLEKTKLVYGPLDSTIENENEIGSINVGLKEFLGIKFDKAKQIDEFEAIGLGNYRYTYKEA